MRQKKEINVQLGQRLKAAREARGLTQEMLAEKVDVSAQYISDVERGMVGVSLSTLKRLCLMLQVSSDQLLFGAGQELTFAPLEEKCQSLSARQQQLLTEIIQAFLEAVEP